MPVLRGVFTPLGEGHRGHCTGAQGHRGRGGVHQSGKGCHQDEDARVVGVVHAVGRRGTAKGHRGRGGAQQSGEGRHSVAPLACRILRQDKDASFCRQLLGPCAYTNINTNMCGRSVYVCACKCVRNRP